MRKKDKEILLRDLSTRLSYGVVCKGVKVDIDVFKDEYVNREVGGLLTNIGYNCCTLGIMTECELSTIKPYLRPLSSMTEEERKEYKHLVAFSGSSNGAANFVDWLNARYFDYRGLIPMGLAIEVTEENNPYKE